MIAPVGSCGMQYINPQDHLRLGQAELLVIDEAAAIPLPMVRQLMGNYLVFMSSTVNGLVDIVALSHTC